MKRISLVAALVGAIVLAFAGIAMAGNGYGSQPGFAVASANTVCAGHGAFGAFGNGQATHDFGKDMSPTATVSRRVSTAPRSGSTTRVSAATAKAAPSSFCLSPPTGGRDSGGQSGPGETAWP